MVYLLGVQTRSEPGEYPYATGWLHTDPREECVRPIKI
jgi:hypothetical protein